MRTLPSRNKLWIGIAAAACTLGLLLLANDSATGFFFIVMGIVYLALSAREANSSRLAVDSTVTRLGLWIAAVLLVLLAAVIAATILLK